MYIFTFKNPAIGLVSNIFGHNLKKRISPEREFAMGVENFKFFAAFRKINQNIFKNKKKMKNI